MDLISQNSLQPVAAQLAAHAGLLVAAGGGEHVVRAAVDVDRTGPQPPGDGKGAILVG